jgi:hypothetical protein
VSRGLRRARTIPWLSPWVLACAFGAPAAAQDGPSRDELDFQGRSNIVVGSGARALGMAGAFLARADDATAASWNPAGLSYLRFPEVSLVGKGDWFDVSTRAPGPERLDDGTDMRRGQTVDFLALTHPVDLGSVTGAVQFSYQRIISFNDSRDIIRNRTPIRIDQEGGFDVLAFGTGLRVSRKWRFGATLNRWFHGFFQTFERGGAQPTLLRTDFDFAGWNANLGVLYSPFENLNLGFVGKTPFTAGVRQVLERANVANPTGPPQNRFDSAIATYPRIEIEFPGAIGFGASWRPSSPWTLSADYTRTFWSNGRIRNYYTLPFTGTPLENAPNHFYPELPYPILNQPDQTDSEQLRVGVEFVADAGGAVAFPIRAGYFNDRQYFLAEDGSPPRFDGFTAGLGVIIGPILFDAAYTYERGSYLDVDGSGRRIRVKAQQVFLSLIYRHVRR